MSSSSRTTSSSDSIDPHLRDLLLVKLGSGPLSTVGLCAEVLPLYNPWRLPCMCYPIILVLEEMRAEQAVVRREADWILPGQQA